MANATFAEVTDTRSGKKFYVEYDNEVDREKIFDKLGLAGGAVQGSGVSFPNNTTYVFRKMGVKEFEKVQQLQRLPYPLKNHPFEGEKWITESLHHTQRFKNKGVTGPEVVTEISVDRQGYADIRGKAIPQAGSKEIQPKNSRPFNITNDERLRNHPSKVNLGLKGNENVDAFNRHVVNISKIDPNSFVNKNKVFRWIRRNKVQTGAVVLGVAIDAAYITISLINDEGTFGESTQIAVGEIIGAVVGANAATSIGATIGAAIGSVVPVLGNIVLGFIGGLIGSLVGGGIVGLARYLFCVAPSARGPGAPILDTDPYSTYRGQPDVGLESNARGLPVTGYTTGAIGMPTMDYDTGAFGTPQAEYKTRRM